MSANPVPMVRSDSITLQHWLVAVFTERCWSTLLEWGTGGCARSDTIASLHAELESLAHGLEDGNDLALLGRLAAATGVAMAIACRTGDDDDDTSDDEGMVAEGVDTVKMLLRETWDTARALDESRRARWLANVPIRLRTAAARLADSPDDTTSELASCAGVLFALLAVTPTTPGLRS